VYEFLENKDLAEALWGKWQTFNVGQLFNMETHTSNEMWFHIYLNELWPMINQKP
jgi:hypothetical protein